jgi:hypothetical protein
LEVSKPVSKFDYRFEIKYMNKNNTKGSKQYTNTEIGALADAFEKDLITIKRWIATNDDRLTSEKALRSLAAIHKSAPVRKTV